MRIVKNSLPVFFALFFVFGLSYYLFSIYKPNLDTSVKGTKSAKEEKDYLDSLPLPSGSKEAGRSISDSFSQITVLTPKSPVEVQKFYRSVLASKGWKTKDNSDESLFTIYTRDKEKIEVAVLSSDAGGAVFSLSHSN